MGLVAIYQRPCRSDPHPEDRIFTLSATGSEDHGPIESAAHHVTYLPMRRGFLCLVAILTLRQAQEGHPQGAGQRLSTNHGRCLLRRGSEGGHRPFWQSGHLQHRSGPPVHWAGFQRRVASGRSDISLDAKRAGWTISLSSACEDHR